ncbi:CAMK/CAMKL/CHK1 protein kinase Chk1 [Schizosaccharomyces japonicus yFS275]|uniref:non-specific serine/threonine protein kinase n=1 Tax=Schizosaccharomyces japonicus (strain yFS275 / FY16936) TaxID=402676 RepID=B6JYL9_SCHJY|nr:CAMK/CAMKL/CHK1 protein kinase Chk1 [Schizosaccharomyces japonicus yFS275]EEB06637.1 CAMK/CAMKL/CHK1 protein kinase Chk1 [Schizosaccharomyces japonicus yFS275]
MSTIEGFPYQIGRELGEGAFASVRACFDDKARVFAVKLVNKNYVAQKMNMSVWTRRITSEIQLHKICNNHKNIIHFYASGDSPTWRWIVLEYAQGGDLFDKIEPDVGVDEDVAQFYFAQLMDGIKFMHSKGVAHRDLKPENLLLDFNGNLKISDFGFAALFSYKGKTRLLNSAVGSPPYAAPEILGQYDGAKVDVWSCGIILFALLLGTTPWDAAYDNSEEYVFFRDCNERPSYHPWNQLSPGAYSLIMGMLRHNPQKRYSVQRVLQHPWLHTNISFRSSSGACSDPIALASRLMLKLRIDLNVSAIPTETTKTRIEDNAATSMTQPPARIEDSLLDSRNEYSTLSQPVMDSTVFTATNIDTDPALSQFCDTTEFLESLTQKAKRFEDICPPERMTRFYSRSSETVILQHLYDCMRKLAVSVTSKKETKQTVLYIRLHDKRKCQLQGEITIQSIAQGLKLINFNKRFGDPLEWRKFFKIVASSMGKSIVLTY